MNLGPTDFSHRKCASCKAVKALGEFYTSGPKSRHRLGVASWCKSCRKGNEKVRRQDAVLVRKFQAKYETDMSFRARELLRAIKKRCVRKALMFDLDTLWLATKLSGGYCELTGLPFDCSVTARRRNAFTPSVDRIRPELGYVKSNCRVVIYAVNVAMSDWGRDVLMRIADALVSKKEKEGAA